MRIGRAIGRQRDAFDLSVRRLPVPQEDRRIRTQIRESEVSAIDRKRERRSSSREADAVDLDAVAGGGGVIINRCDFAESDAVDIVAGSADKNVARIIIKGAGVQRISAAAAEQDVLAGACSDQGIIAQPAPDVTGVCRRGQGVPGRRPEYRFCKLLKISDSVAIDVAKRC